MSALPAGPELDAAVAKAIGWEPDSFEVCGVRFSTRKHAELASKSQGWGAVIIEHWAPVSTDGTAMLRLIEAMRGLGWLLKVTQWTPSGVGNASHFYVAFEPCSRIGRSTALQHAVALAALQALSGETGETQGGKSGE